MLRKTLLVLAVAAALAACSKDAKDPAKAAASASASAAPVRLLVAPEDIFTVQSSSLASGPLVTGSVQPARKADLRAEVSAIVLQVLKENGDVVRRGEVLVKLDETALRDSLNSAEEASRVAVQALDQAERNVQRVKTLRASGMTSVQSLDDSEVRRNAAQSEVAAARTRAAQARQQIGRTLVRAPFDGIVSDRKVSAGDTAGLGKELLKVIDPSSMRFEGRVSADKISMVKTGQPVMFRVNGYAGQQFEGKVTRVDPSANEVTRQVEVLVGFSDTTRPRVSGLYAEGRIEAESVSVLMVPERALVKAGDKSYVWRVNGKSLSKTELVIGSRDPRTGYFEIKSGLVAGASIMATPGSSFSDGQPVELSGVKVASSAAATVQGK